jgi:hypothetical protein
VAGGSAETTANTTSFVLQQGVYQIQFSGNFTDNTPTGPGFMPSQSSVFVFLDTQQVEQDENIGFATSFSENLGPLPGPFMPRETFSFTWLVASGPNQVLTFKALGCPNNFCVLLGDLILTKLR